MSDDLIKGSVWPWKKTDLIVRLLAEETDLTDCAADHIEQTEAKLTKALETLREFAKQKRTTEMDVDEYDQADIEGAYCQFIFKAHAVLAELEGEDD